MIFVSSWDDGHPLDARLGELLEHHGLNGTFYVPIRNREGHAVMSHAEMRNLDRLFEMASHTLDHCYLTSLNHTDCEHQVREGKQQLESILGHSVPGFCYPGGKWNARVRQTVINAGFEHARTVGNLWLGITRDAFSIPTTAQFYPHRAKVLWRNYLSGGHYGKRLPALRTLTTSGDWLTAMTHLADDCATRDGVMHIWGHSWEIEQHGLWPQLDALLTHVASLRPRALTVGELASMMSGLDDPRQNKGRNKP